MLENLRSSIGVQFQRLKTGLVSKKPHFDFISAHYLWIVSATIVASIPIYAAGHGGLAYIDALMFASGANTQAGLNPVNLNSIDLFQQIVIYIFTMMSNPIVLHGSVVFLRLYWFEKRFDGLVQNARLSRGTLSKTKSQAQPDLRRIEEGVNGRNITHVTNQEQPNRVAKDGFSIGRFRFQSNAIEDDEEDEGPSNKLPASSNESDVTAVSGRRSNSIDLDPLERPKEAEYVDKDGQAKTDYEQMGTQNQQPPQTTAITFADTVKRSDGVGDDPTKFPQRRAHAEHIAILERQRNPDDEVLRIPGPRDAERGMGPRRLDEDGDHEDDVLSNSRTVESRPDHATVDSRNPRGHRPTITIAEPAHKGRERLAEDAKAVEGTLDAMRFRKPRLFNRNQGQLHEDGESHQPPRPLRTRTLETIRSVLTRDREEDQMPYLSYTPTMARNSNFVDLTLEQREELGGIEYRSLRTLALVLLFYFWGFHLIAVTCLLPFILHNKHYGQIVDQAGASRTWWGIFTANSAFMDLGFTLTPDSMNSFNTSEYTLMIMWFFIIIGNTGFPVMLRFMIWVLSKVTPRGSGLWEELRFLLDHPRRCFTLLFPSGPNWWLFWILVTLNAVDLLFFVVLDLNSSYVAQVPVHTRIVDGLFQAAATRTAGFSCYSMSALHPAMPVLYMIMMYISVFPIAISIRRTNVYEEKSLGVYADKKDEDYEANEASALSYVGTHLRRQLSFDLWYVFLGFFILAISEGSKIQAGKFDLFAVLFEIVSAYGTVGLSMGAVGTDAALSSQFTVVGKLVIVAMQIRGRHRGLPYGLDRAVLLPSEARFKKEVEEGQPILVRTATGASNTGVSTGMERQRRGSSVARGRSMSRTRDRANSNLITQLLHPGPVISNSHIHGHKRNESEGEDTHLRRITTQPIPEDGPIQLRPMRTTDSHMKTRRAETTPFS